jgi:hypothetical protein
MEKPHVVEVRGARAGITLYWRVITNDQREWYLAKATHHDELAAFLAVTKTLDEQEQNDDT